MLFFFGECITMFLVKSFKCFFHDDLLPIEAFARVSFIVLWLIAIRFLQLIYLLGTHSSKAQG